MFALKNIVFLKFAALFVGLSLCVLPEVSYAQNAAPLFQCTKELKKSEGKAFLEKAQSAYGKLRSLTADFSQESYLSALEISENSSGKVWFSKPGRMRWYYSQPEEQIFIVRDKTVWLYQVGDKQVMIDQFSKILISDLPVAFLLGIGDLSRDFSLVGVCEIANPKGVLLELVPAKKAAKGSDKGLEGFDLAIDPKSNLPVGARIRDVGGNLNIISMSNLKSDAPVEESLFEAEFPAGTDIDDRRLAVGGKDGSIP